MVSMLVGTTLAGLSESLALSTKLGLNITDVLEVLRHSSANSPFIQEKGFGECVFTVDFYLLNGPNLSEKQTIKSAFCLSSQE